MFFGAGCDSPPAVKVRDLLRQLIRCDSGTDSIVWMREEIVRMPVRWQYYRDTEIIPGFYPGIYVFLVSFRIVPLKVEHDKIKGGKRMKEKWLTTKNLVLMGMFGALAGVLMMFEFPLVFLAPSFYALDFSEVPVLVGTFAIGPAAGVVIEFLKIVIKLLMKPSTTGFIGEYANFVIGCALVVPAGMIYHTKKTKKGAIKAMAAGTLIMTVSGIAINALVMLPFYSNVMPLEAIIEAGAAINPAVSSVWSLALICVGPFNLIKGVVVSVVTLLVYKRISNLIHSVNRK